MQKKLLAVAVAGALAAPVAVMAQTTTATIYGTVSLSIENASSTGADSAIAGGSTLRGGTLGGNYAGSPADQSSRTRTQGAGSNFGVRVREDLGAGMYAWLQAELSIQAAGVGALGATSGGQYASYRNSGLAVGSNAWGDFIIGVWDTPLNVNMNPAPQHAAYSNASTSFSAGMFGSNPIAGGSTVSTQQLSMSCPTQTAAANTTSIPAGLPGATTAFCFNQAMSFHRRQPDTVQYWSPTWSGFQLKGMYGTETITPANGAFGAGTPTPKPRLLGGSLTYSAGPLYLGLGYERHTDFTAFAAQSIGANAAVFSSGGANGSTAAQVNFGRGGATGTNGSRDTAWNLNARYTFGAFTLGAYFESLKWTWDYATVGAADVTEMKKKAWGLEGAWVAGPHTLGLRYAKNNNVEVSAAVPVDAGGSGARAWMLAYAYSMSKRTSAFVYHTHVNNDTNARYSGIVFGGLATAPGGQPRYTGLGLRHTF